MSGPWVCVYRPLFVNLFRLCAQWTRPCFQPPYAIIKVYANSTPKMFVKTINIGTSLLFNPIDILQLESIYFEPQNSDPNPLLFVAPSWSWVGDHNSNSNPSSILASTNTRLIMFLANPPKWCRADDRPSASARFWKECLMLMYCCTGIKYTPLWAGAPSWLHRL